MDTESLLRSLNARRVRYVVIGAGAFPVHGYGRTTLDLNVLIEPTRENAERTLEALTDLGYDIKDLTVEEMLQKKILFRQYILDLDIHPEAAGVTFHDVWKNKIRKKLRNTFAYYASLDDLIKMKRARQGCTLPTSQYERPRRFEIFDYARSNSGKKKCAAPRKRVTHARKNKTRMKRVLYLR